MSEQYKQLLAADRKLVEDYLRTAFRNDEWYGDLQESMEYSLLAGGKRLRPVLVLACCRLCGEMSVRRYPSRLRWK